MLLDSEQAWDRARRELVTETGIRSARAAGMRVLAVPDPHFPPAAEALGEATLLADLAALTPDAVEGR